MQRMSFENQRGYSLGELLWVIVILSIVAGLAIPRLDWMKYRVNAESRNIALQLTYAQRLAVSLQHDVRVTLDHAARRLIVDEDKNNDGTFGAGERRRVVQLDDGINFERNGVATLPAPLPSNELLTIIYRRDGSADQAGVIYLNTNRGVAIGANKDARALEVVRATGRATTYSYASGAWVKGS
ncbi:MAG: prepilin-type N-terminal cleavage/methylation domain-containing protein [Gemmatimonadetes bacterium]|nr:prepilin-type N-terminal cleavage/methylation domain-containing protein [Gemmatimonadota bacterium]